MTTAPVGKTVLTAQGLLALTDATRLGKKITPKYFKVSSRDYDLYPGIDLQDLSDVWHQGDISGVFPINDNTTEFLIDIPPEKATNFGKTFGLYLEDGTLFLVGKPPYPFAPLMRQTFKMQLVWLNANEIVDFRYIPFYAIEQNLSLLDSLSSLALSLFDIQEHLGILEQAKNDFYAFKSFSNVLKKKLQRLNAEFKLFKKGFKGKLQDKGYYWIKEELLIQWGKVLVKNGHGVFNFPIPFPTTCFQIVATDVGEGCHSIGISPIDNSRFEVWTKDAAGNTPPQTGVRFIAVGF